MSVEAIVGVIGTESTAEAARIVADAGARAVEIVAAAERSVATRVRLASERADPAARAEGMRRVNAMRLRLLELRAEQAAALVDAVFADAAARLDAVASAPAGTAEGERWRIALGSLIAEAVRSAGPDASVTVRRRDHEAARPIVATLGARLADAPRDDVPPGALVESADGRILVDATLPSRLARARVARAEAVVRSLGLEA
jgi:vacuolar-type H+-ATPase subunit E/Vma4